jgi:inorganic pyrophosphatase/exopolyphosphatase
MLVAHGSYVVGLGAMDPLRVRSLSKAVGVVRVATSVSVQCLLSAQDYNKLLVDSEAYVPGILSRKKQIVPILSKYLDDEF